LITSITNNQSITLSKTGSTDAWKSVFITIVEII
jgi:uncharacterized protein YlxP (DUF503 family)